MTAQDFVGRINHRRDLLTTRRTIMTHINRLLKSIKAQCLPDHRSIEKESTAMNQLLF